MLGCLAVFPYSNGSNRLFMDTEKAHSIKHCHVDVTNYANPINWWAQEVGQVAGLQNKSGRLRVVGQDNDVTHSLNGEASLLLSEAMLCRVEDGDATAEDWTDAKGRSLPADCIWNDGCEVPIANDDERPCMGIELNIWKRAKVDSMIIYIICIIQILTIILIYEKVRRHIVHTLVANGWWRGPAWGFQCS